MAAAIESEKCHFRRSGMYENLKLSWYALHQPMVPLCLDSKREPLPPQKSPAPPEPPPSPNKSPSYATGCYT